MSPLLPIHCRICYRAIGADVDEDGNLFTDLCPECEAQEWYPAEEYQ